MKRFCVAYLALSEGELVQFLVEAESKEEAVKKWELSHTNPEIVKKYGTYYSGFSTYDEMLDAASDADCYLNVIEV